LRADNLCVDISKVYGVITGNVYNKTTQRYFDVLWVCFLSNARIVTDLFRPNNVGSLLFSFFGFITMYVFGAHFLFYSAVFFFWSSQWGTACSHFFSRLRTKTKLRYTYRRTTTT